MPQLRAPTPRGKRLRPGRVNAGVEAAYRRQLQALIRDMHREVIATIAQHVRAAAPQIATDASPFALLLKTMSALRTKWGKIFRDKAEAMAERFVHANQRDTEADLRRRFKDAGFAMRFKPDIATQQRIKLAVEENVSLIRSIPEQYHTQLRTLVTQSVMQGGDVATLTQQLHQRYGITERRAAMIARDQNHKIAVGIEQQKCAALGMTKARWKHAGAGRHPRPEHVEASRKGLIYDSRGGAMIGGKRIWPGSEPNCHCRAEYIIPGYNDIQPRRAANDSNPDQPRDELGRFMAVGGERFYHEHAKRRAQEIDPADRGRVLTRAGRALQKHGGRPGSAFPRPQGNPQAINAHGQHLLEEIMDDPELLVFLMNEHRRYGKSFHAFTRNGTSKGASFYPKHNMIGFREPLSDEQLKDHLRKYPHGRK